ncbi:YheC/YheD family protein [Mesobacillus harenae]|uniref:YheC/YheD family protein n=1 Tax=Mesobacillus harenae TaxID=2213203 RepID=UPI00157FDA91|nr:YheC/YheD family protein [Mesobacillus harenae]
MNYSIILNDQNGEASLYLNHKTKTKLKINDYIVIKFGVLEKNLKVSVDKSLRNGELRIPKKLTDAISIPDLPFEFYFKENKLVLGPVIGFIPQSFLYQDTDLLLPRFSNYEEIKGLIFIFEQENINGNNLTIKGKYYNPKSKTFEEGVFPFPMAVYSRIYMKKKIVKYFKDAIGNNLFNVPYYIGKRTFHKIMKTSPKISHHLPVTKLNKGNNLREMLNDYSSIYLKPSNLSRGRGIYHLKSSKGGYILTDNLSNTTFYQEKDELIAEMSKRLDENYLIQQEIMMYQDHKKIDFRVFFQKDSSQEWQFSGLETRVAKKGSIISNWNNREDNIVGEKGLRKYLDLNADEANSMIEEITILCIEALKIMERKGYLIGDTAIDIVIDKEKKIWFLEVQLNYGAEYVKKRGKEEDTLLPSIITIPFEYAKSLSGFK